MTTCNSIIVSNIQRFSLDDGPGIRTTVFLKGCNLKCVWCHNPECISYEKEIEYLGAKCAACGRCLQACPVGAKKGNTGEIDRNLCIKCGECVKACRNGALEEVGREMTVDELIAEIRKDRAYYKESGGGVTISGGDPMTQVDFVEKLLVACKSEGFHTAIDTAGNVPESNFERIVGLADLFLYDIKLLDSEKHRKYTGAGNEQIWSNLSYLNKAGARIKVRIPVIKGINDSLEDLAIIADKLTHFECVESVKLLPYHSYGEGKYKSLDMKYDIGENAVPDDSFMKQAESLFSEKGIEKE